MKKLKYFYMGNAITMDYTQENESLAIAEADNGEFVVEDDGIEKSPLPTIDERLKMLEKVMTHLKAMFPNLQSISE